MGGWVEVGGQLITILGPYFTLEYNNFETPGKAGSGLPLASLCCLVRPRNNLPPIPL